MQLALLTALLGALAGFAVFSIDSLALGVIMTFCAGGILYLVFDDIAPDAHEPGDRTPALGAVLGFTVALIGFGSTR